MSQKYREGNFFSVPLGHGGFALGLIARKPRRGSVLLGYFFGPRRNQADITSGIRELVAADAELVCRFKDTGLHRGLWRVVAVSPEWDRSLWPVPAFLRKEGLSGRDIRVEYDSDSLTMSARETAAGVTEEHLSEDVVLDEERLTEHLSRLLQAHRAEAVGPGQWTG